MTQPAQSTPSSRDPEQERRHQAHLESEWGAGRQTTHPPFTKKGPGVTLPTGRKARSVPLK